MGISQLETFGDSKLVINQILEQYDVKKEDHVLQIREEVASKF